MRNKPEPITTKTVVVGGGLAIVLALAMPVVKYFEGKSNDSYYDNLPSVALVTACYGHTDKGLKIGERFTDAQCDDFLIKDLITANKGVDTCIKVPLSDNQRAALISFTFNVGQGKLCKSTLAKKANAGQPFCSELSKWVYAGGKVRNGLVKRRAAERAMCESK